MTICNLHLPIWLTVAMITTMYCPGTAQAGLIINIYDSGQNVEANVSGTIDLNSFPGGTWSASVAKMLSNPGIIIGNTAQESFDAYSTGHPAGPLFNFTSMPNLAADLGSGSKAGWYSGYLIVPSGYVSGQTISASSTFQNTSLSALGITAGSNTINWSYIVAESLTVNIGPAAAPVSASVPEPSSYLMMAGLLCFVTYRRRRAKVTHASEGVLSLA